MSVGSSGSGWAVVFEVLPDPARMDDYLGMAAALRPALEGIPGFIDNQRFRSRTRPGVLLSLSLWEDEAAIVRWREVTRHRHAQQAGREGIFRDYRLRVGKVMNDAATCHDVPPGPARILTLVDGAPTDGASCVSAEAIAGDAVERKDDDVFEHLSVPRRALVMRGWADTRAAAEYLRGPGAASDNAQRLAVCVVRDYGMRDRREAPQTFPLRRLKLMDTEDLDSSLARFASVLAEPARSRMLGCLMDGHARTSTELAVVANVGAPTASAHIHKMMHLGLLDVTAQGRHRYYRLASPEVAHALETLMVAAGPAMPRFLPATPAHLRDARTCYDHLAGELGVACHDRWVAMGWLLAEGGDYRLTAIGQEAMRSLGLPLPAGRRRFAYPCLDWSVRRPHLGGALASAFLDLCLDRGWLRRQLGSRALVVTPRGRRELAARFGVSLPGTPLGSDAQHCA